MLFLFLPNSRRKAAYVKSQYSPIDNSPIQWIISIWCELALLPWIEKRYIYPANIFGGARCVSRLIAKVPYPFTNKSKLTYGREFFRAVWPATHVCQLVASL